jgi:hypothetical protein
MFEVDISAMSPARFRLGRPAARYEAFERAMEEGRRILSGEPEALGQALDDPRDLKAYGDAVCSLLLDPSRAQQMGLRARERDEFTSPRSLLDYLAVIENLLARRSVRAAA